MSRANFDSEIMEAIYQKNMADIGNAYVKARDELMELRHKQAQVLRFFRYNPAQRAWVARIEDNEVALLNLLGFFRP